MQAPQATLDLVQAQEIGAKLKAAREALNLPASKVANILLLSRHQIESLESGDLSVFYNAQFYAQAADKYAAFLELVPAPSETLLAQTATAADTPVQPVDVPVAETIVAPKIIGPAVSAARARIVKRTVLMGMLVAIAAGAYLQRDVIRDVIAAQWPASETKVAAEAASTPVAAPVVPPTPVAAVPPPAVEIPPPAPVATIAADTVVITFSGSSWVQIVSADGSKREHTYKAGDTLTVEPAKLQALIIGNADVATAESAKGPVKLNAHVAPGSKVARIIGPAVRSLGQ